MQVIRIVSALLLASFLAADAQTTSAPGQPAAPAISGAPAPASAGVLYSSPVPSSTTVELVTRAISLQEAIDSALQHNFDVQIQRIDPEIARYSLGLSYGGYDPNLFASGQHSYSKSPGGLDAQGRIFGGNETEADTFRAGLAGFLPWGLNYNLNGNASDQVVNNRTTRLTNPVIIPILGTNANNPADVFVVGYQTNYTEIISSITTEDSFAQVGAITLSQPLLRNFWIDPTRANIQVAKNRLKYSEYALRFLLMGTILEVERAYNNLIFARENVKVQELALQLADRLLWENRKKVEVGQLAPLDEKQAQSEAAARRADLLATQRTLDLQENVLKSLITDDFRNLHHVRLIPAENLVAVPPLLDLQRSWDMALQQRPDLIQARLDLERSDINVRLYKNQLFPALDLIGQYGYAGRGKEFSGAFGQINSTDNPFWYYGAQISYPIGNRTARNNYKISKAQKEQNQLLLRQKEQIVMIEVDNAVKLVQTNFERIGATREARLFAEAALDAEQKKLENGKSTSFLVLQAQRDLTAARFEEIRALTEYNNALAEVSNREGASLDRQRLKVNLK